MKTKTFVEGNAATKNFIDAMGALFRDPKAEIKKPPTRKKNRNRKVNG